LKVIIVNSNHPFPNLIHSIVKNSHFSLLRKLSLRNLSW